MIRTDIFWPNAKGEYGFPAHKTIVNRVKAEVEQKGGSLILLNAGDFNTGVPESDMQTAEPDIKAMNAMGYEATVLGNHEFDIHYKFLICKKNGQTSHSYLQT